MTNQQKQEQGTEELEEEEEERLQRLKKQKEIEKKEKIKKKRKPEKKVQRYIVNESIKSPEVTVPVLKLEEPKIEIKSIKINKDIPKILIKETEIKIPIVKLEELKIEIKSSKINKDIPKIPIKETKIKFSIVKIKPIKIRIIQSNFDSKIPKIIIPPKLPRIPLYKSFSSFPLREKFTNFNKKINKNLLERLKFLKKKHPPIITEEIMSDFFGDNSFGTKGNLKNLPDIIEFIFGVSNSDISSDQPKIILYKELEKDSTIGSFETLCVRIYREKKGGRPKFIPIKKLDNFNKKLIEKWEEANNKLINIDLDENIEEARNWFCKKNLNEPLRRHIFGDIGYIIFKTRDQEIYNYCKKVLNLLKDEIEHEINLIFIKPPEIIFEKKKEISHLIWGLLNLDDINNIAVKSSEFERYIGTGIFDDVFNKVSKNVYKEALKNLEFENDGAYINATKPHEGEESREHKELKWFIIKYLTKKLIKQDKLHPIDPNKPKAFEINQFIITEEDTKDILNNNRADIMDVPNSEVYEIETLYAEDREGKVSTEKLNYTIDKYKGLENVKKINIILENLTFLRHLKTLKNVGTQKSEKERKRIRFYTLDIQNNELISLNDYIEKFRLLMKKE